MKAIFSLHRQYRLALACAALLLPGLTHGQTAPLIIQPVDAARRQVLSHTVHPLVKSATDLGRANSSLAMKDMLLMLQPPSSKKAIEQYVKDLHNPSSPSFHKWLTPQQYAAKFGAAAADVTAVSGWLTSSGFTVEHVSRANNLIRFSGTASQVESAFQTEIHKYSVNGTTRYANSANISIPAALAPAVLSVVSMNNFVSTPQHTPLQKMTRNSSGKMILASGANIPARQGSSASPAFTGTNGQVVNFVTPGDFSAIYDAQPVVASGTNGSGVSIAVVGRSDINISDIEAFRTISGLPFNDPTVTYATTDPGIVSGDDEEASLDVEWAAAVAPQATIKYVIGASTNTTDGVDVSASYIVDNVTAPIMTVSFGLCEALQSDSEIAFYHLLWQQAATEGITVLVAAGDAGASGCNEPAQESAVYGFGVNALASTPYDTAVGGTEFNDLSDPSTYWNTANAANLASAKGYIPEAVWNESCENATVPSATNCAYAPYYLYTYAGGGGASSCISRTTDDSGDEFCAAGYPKPSWQTGPGVPQDGVRDIPDVSLASASEHDPFIFCFGGDCQWTANPDGSITLLQADLVGGTSVASPSMASILALVEQKAGAFQGVANYQLYSLAAGQAASSCDSSGRTSPTQPSACIFNDITAGSNAMPCFSGNQDCGGTDQPVPVGVVNSPAIFPPDSEMDGHSAAAGYDLGTGLGSVDVSNLVNGWGKLNLIASTTTLSLSQTTFQHGASITLNGAVSPASGSGLPTGEVVIVATNTNGAIQTLPLTAGAFTGSTIDLPGGTYTVTAAYSGDGTYSPSTSAPVSLTVTQENSTVTGTSFAISPLRFRSGNTLLQTSQALLGYPWFLQFNVAGVSGSTAATGTIKLSNGSTVIGTFPVSSAGEIYVDCGQGGGCDFPVGVQTFTAQYSGDSSFKPSTTTYQFTLVQGQPFWINEVNNQTPIANTQAVAYVYFSVTDPAVPPTGTMTLTRGDTGAVLGSATIDSTGLATIPFNVGSGAYQLIATWPGDANYSNAKGNEQTQSIQTLNNPGTTPVKVVLSLGGSSFQLGQRTQYSVSVTPTQKNSATPIGSIDLWTGYGQIAASIELAGGKATGTVEWDSSGPQSVYAVYEGDGNFAGANTTPVAVTVTQATPTLTVLPMSSYAGVGTVTSVTALLTSPLSSSSAPAPTGTIQFYNSLNGAAVQPIGMPQAVAIGNGGTLVATLAPALPLGSNAITAVYSGDANWKSATAAASVPIVVTTPGFTDIATPNPLTVAAGDTASITVSTQSILGFSSQIALACTGTLPVGVTCGSATVAPGASATLSLATTAPGVSSASAAVHTNSLWKFSGAVAAAGLFLICIPNRRRFYPLSALLLTLSIVGGVAGCGGSSAKPTMLAISSSSTKVASGSSVTLLATIQSSNNPKGTVTFFDGSTAIGNAVSPVDGVASLNTSSLNVGTHAITAKYSGDSLNTASASSDVLEQTITGGFSITVNATAGALVQSISIPATLQ
jgi:subtilase family serine protease